MHSNTLENTLSQAPVEPVDTNVYIGKSKITQDLVFVGRVCGGGDCGPGRVIEITNYDQRTQLRWEQDLRSGSKKSGHITVQLEEDSLYRLEYVATSHQHMGTFFVCTDGGIARVMSGVEFNRLRKSRWPEAHQRYLAAKRRERAE